MLEGERRALLDPFCDWLLPTLIQSNVLALCLVVTMLFESSGSPRFTFIEEKGRLQHTHAYIHMYFLYAGTQVHLQVNRYMYMCTHIHIFIHVCIYGVYV